jgi:hypothetical protein
MKSILTFFIFCIFSGCSSNDFGKYNEIRSFRVLALKASAPEVSTGASPTITPVVSDIDGNGRTITYSVEACSDPGIGFGATPSCSGASDQTNLGTFNSSALNSGNYYTSALTALTVTIPSTALSNRSTIEQYNGVAYIVIFTFTLGGTQVKAFKRIIVSTNPTKNNNPSLSDLKYGSQTGSSATVLISDTAASIFPTFSGTSRETYSSLTSTGETVTSVEDLDLTWFTTDPEFSLQRTTNDEANGLKNGAGIRPKAIVVVVRDGRGGEDFLIRRF